MLRTAVITRAILADFRLRRRAMFGLVVGALVLLLAGATVLDGVLRERPVVFLLYWAACGWVTAAAGLLAVFDMLRVRAEGRAERRRLRRETFWEGRGG